MSMWVRGRLYLGAMGWLSVWSGGLKTWTWDWCVRHNGADAILHRGEGLIATEAVAQRAAERWLRAALKQAAKKIGGE